MRRQQVNNGHWVSRQSFPADNKRRISFRFFIAISKHLAVQRVWKQIPLLHLLSALVVVVLACLTSSSSTQGRVPCSSVGSGPWNCQWWTECQPPSWKWLLKLINGEIFLNAGETDFVLSRYPSVDFRRGIQLCNCHLQWRFFIAITIIIIIIMMKRNDTAQTGQSFFPRCEERPDCGSTKVESDCLCSGIT